jgi:hypothetical protein
MQSAPAQLLTRQCTPISWILVGKPFSSHNHLPIK